MSTSAQSRSIKPWLLLCGAIVMEVTATLALRAAVDHPAWIVLVVLGYSGAFVCLALVLREGMPIGVAYGIWAACGVALTAVLAAIIFDDPFTWVIALGIGVVIVGVLLVELGSHRAEMVTMSTDPESEQP
ncbi:small multidrug resistance pump [Williamsia limnetica]|jgi:small multidrug resistance pump|uniref:Small multidrug resistance pump n=1 Tax=Williamsia limnetica TaxID=882452 RepID=A0A318RZ24_WILLI|nr:small multidrug resistance pump [Williamsia limnetica]